MKQSPVLIAIFAIWCHCVEESLAQNEKQALIIDRLTRSIIDLPPSISENSQCGSWANACPAQSTADEDFVAKNAIGENPLFIKQICIEGETLEMAKFGIDICSKYFQISVVFNTKNYTFDFGYEVYVSEEYKGLISTPKKRKNYISVEKLLRWMKTDQSNKKVTEVPKELSDLVFGEENTFPHDGRKMSFMWISIFEVEFYFQQLTPKIIFYQVRNNNRWPAGIRTTCKEYKLANEVYRKFFKEVYQSNDLKTMYDEIHQQMMFISYILPDEKTSAGCRNRRVCLNQWPLIPIDQFHFGASEEKMCSNMSTVPIWSSTLWFPMINVDKFIYALFQAMGSSLHVVAGISGQLQLPYEAATEIFFKTEIRKKDMYMDILGKKVPIPKIIYKLVKYKSDDCLEGDSCWYSATIIIHNDPYFDPENKICPDVTTEWGWTEVNLVNGPGLMQKSHQSKYIYVCKSEPELLSLLMGISAEKQPQKMKDFNLTEFPSKDTENSIYGASIEGEVFKNLLDLTEIQNKLFAIERNRILAEDERQRILAKKKTELLRKKYLDRIKEEDITDDNDSKGDTDEPIQPSSDDDVIREIIEGNDDGEIHLNEEERPLLGESKAYSRKKYTDRATTSYNSDSKELPMDKSGKENHQ